jgi:hypothetical protein
MRSTRFTHQNASRRFARRDKRRARKSVLLVGAVFASGLLFRVGRGVAGWRSVSPRRAVKTDTYSIEPFRAAADPGVMPGPSFDDGQDPPAQAAGRERRTKLGLEFSARAIAVLALALTLAWVCALVFVGERLLSALF